MVGNESRQRLLGNVKRLGTVRIEIKTVFCGPQAKKEGFEVNPMRRMGVQNGLYRMSYRQSGKTRKNHIFVLFFCAFGTIFIVSLWKDMLKSSVVLFCFNLNLELFDLLI